MKNQLIRLAEERKISKIGFCSPANYIEYSKNQNYEVLENFSSIIVCAFGYYSGNEMGNISKYARGRDYHIVAREKMSVLCDFLKANGHSAESFADIGVLDERLLAQLSGIAFRGKNTMAINAELGSYFFVGYILTDCELVPDNENTEPCINCGACISACPVGALSEMDFNKDKCLSYVTQKKGELSDEEAQAMRKNNTAWGCDICQDVCPHNKNLQLTALEEFKTDLIYNLDIDENISNKEFKERYKNRAFAWRGRAVLIRNQKLLKK